MYLQYGTYTGTTLTLSSPMEFNPIEEISLYETERVAGRTLRKTEYNHLLSNRSIVKIVIGADELYQTSKLDFINNFYQANGGWYYTALTSLPSELDEYVLKESGEIPLQATENNWELPELSITLIQKESL